MPRRSGPPSIWQSGLIRPAIRWAFFCLSENILDGWLINSLAIGGLLLVATHEPLTLDREVSLEITFGH